MDQCTTFRLTTFSRSQCIWKYAKDLPSAFPDVLYWQYSTGPTAWLELVRHLGPSIFFPPPRRNWWCDLLTPSQRLYAHVALVCCTSKWGRLKWLEDRWRLSIKSRIGRRHINEPDKLLIRLKCVLIDLKRSCFMISLISHANACVRLECSPLHPTVRCLRLTSHIVQHRRIRVHLGQSDRRWSVTAIVRRFLHDVEPCHCLGIKSEVPYAKYQQAYEQQVENTGLWRQGMLKHTCLDIMDDPIRDWSLKAFIESPTRLPALIYWEMDSATLLQVHVNVWTTSKVLPHCKLVQYFGTILNWLFDDKFCYVSRTTHGKGLRYEVEQSENADM